MTMINRSLAALALVVSLVGCGLFDPPLSTGDDVAGYEALVELHADDPEAAARFDIFEAQNDAIIALGGLEFAVTHPLIREGAKASLKRLSQDLVEGVKAYSKIIIDCPGKLPDGTCPDFDYTNSKVLAFRDVLSRAQAILVRLASQGLLSPVTFLPSSLE